MNLELPHLLGHLVPSVDDGPHQSGTPYPSYPNRPDLLVNVYQYQNLPSQSEGSTH
ncbi:hypothetical protein L798_03700 [Zootermopsis nevadensis]|uniref:Uncharacterized protein n=1 Tax=Zootermopsis nevadensis TaxID=136037 RepID=A0A067RBI2_ZOONE|nr:hypothetical protein L798_03700 [Zootermopsis nevadensis]